MKTHQLFKFTGHTIWTNCL